MERLKADAKGPENAGCGIACESRGGTFGGWGLGRKSPPR